MALVHESLYKSDDLAKVNVNSYYEDLINDLIEAYNVKQDVEAQISISIEDLGLDTLVPLGLLTNEIISNSLKHGFEKNEKGIIKVDLKSLDGGRFELLIGDNGKGFDFEKQRLSENSLGTELIFALVEQLDGEYEFSNEGGSYYRIAFKPQEKTGIK
jgi:two-component sensor histidine kinase